MASGAYQPDIKRKTGFLQCEKAQTQGNHKIISAEKQEKFSGLLKNQGIRERCVIRNPTKQMHFFSSLRGSPFLPRPTSGGSRAAPARSARASLRPPLAPCGRSEE